MEKIVDFNAFKENQKVSFFTAIGIFTGTIAAPHSEFPGCISMRDVELIVLSGNATKIRLNEMLIQKSQIIAASCGLREESH